VQVAGTEEGRRTVSRAEHTTPTRRRVLSGIVPSVLGIGLALTLVGCGAGQITQTATQQSGVNGTSGMVGPIAIRNLQLAFPNNAQGTYAPGSTARVLVTIVNTGVADDTLLRITSPAVTSVHIDGSPTGTKLIPGGFSVASGVDSDDSVASSSASVAPPATSAPAGTSVPPSTPAGGSVAPTTSSAPSVPGKMTIDLVGIRSVNGAALRAGLTIPMTFYFAHSGQVTLAQVPIGAPADTSS
jgi:hypothetical protein